MKCDAVQGHRFLSISEIPLLNRNRARNTNRIFKFFPCEPWFYILTFQ